MFGGKTRGNGGTSNFSNIGASVLVLECVLANGPNMCKRRRNPGEGGALGDPSRKKALGWGLGGAVLTGRHFGPMHLCYQRFL